MGGLPGLFRREDLRLITGTGCFSADWKVDGCCHAYVVRSDRAHALIRSINIDAASRQPGVLVVVTSADLAEAGICPQRANHSRPNLDGSPFVSTEWFPLAIDCVRYVGEAVAVVVAETFQQAAQAAEEIWIDYEDLPPVIGAEFALSNEAPRIHRHIPGNRIFNYQVGDQAAVSAAIAAAAHVTELTIESRRLAGNPLESRTCIASYDAKNGTYDIYGNFMTPGTVRFFTAEALSVHSEKIRLHVDNVGGGFGLRGLAFPEQIVACVVAKRLKRPVRWSATRSESFFADSHGRGMKFKGTLALDHDNRFTAIHFDVLGDLGAYALPVAPHIMTLTPERGMAGVYGIPSLSAHFQLALTTTVPVSAYRGAGRPDMAYAIERLVDAAAFELHVDRVELRRRNMVTSFPYNTPHGYTYDSGDFIGAMQKALRIAAWDSFEDRRKDSSARGKLRGIGLSTFLEIAGNNIATNDKAWLSFAANGRVMASTHTQSAGQSHDLAFRRIVASALQIDEAAVEFSPAPASEHFFGTGTYASRSTQVAGSLLHRAAEVALAKAVAVLAREWKVEDGSISFAGGEFRAGGHRESLASLIGRLADNTPHPLDSEGEGVPPVSFPNGAHIAEVEIDPRTGELTICNYVAVDDIGVVLDHTVVEGQIIGGVVQGLGQIFGEECIYDDTGQLLNASFGDYYMPRAGLLQQVQVGHHPSPCTTNALGVKGVGECGTTGSLSATMNAIVHALQPAGVRHIDPPVTPAKLWRALHDVGYGAQRT